jgi:hypothetical protein
MQVTIANANDLEIPTKMTLPLTDESLKLCFASAEPQFPNPPNLTCKIAKGATAAPPHDPTKPN